MRSMSDFKDPLYVAKSAEKGEQIVQRGGI